MTNSMVRRADQPDAVPATLDLRRRRRVRVGVLSDTHGTIDARIVSALADCDAIVHAGDIGSAAVLTALTRRARAVVAVRGNNDVPAKWPRAQARALRALPARASVALPGGTLAVLHGDHVTPVSRRHALLRRGHPTARAIVYGHSHRLVLDQSDVPWVLNPGAAGSARTFGGPSCLVLDAAPTRWRVAVIRFSEVRAS